MKKISIFIILGLIVVAPAISSQKCLYKGTLVVGWAPKTNGIDWIVDQDEENGVNISGVGVCTNFEPDAGKYKDYITMPTTSDSISYIRQCWCKMVAPAESQWIWHTTYSSYANCLTSCAEACGYEVSLDTYLGRRLM